MKRAAIVVAVLLAVVAGFAWMRAQQTSGLRYPEVVDAILAQVDTNHDGELTSEEFTRVALPGDPFSRYDVDHDGVISRSELEQAFVRTSPQSTRGRMRSDPLSSGQ
jgi:Ca2+-binding EF-hand superfamily protein